MAGLARIVLPETPHHVTQRGNRRMAIFSETSDYALYRDLLAERLKRCGVVCSAYCLMPNHVHLLLTPTRPDVEGALAARGFRPGRGARAGRIRGVTVTAHSTRARLDRESWLARLVTQSAVRGGFEADRLRELQGQDTD
jgi:REP element-mobilizing transposase RayT